MSRFGKSDDDNGTTKTDPRRMRVYQVIAHWQGYHDGQLKDWADVGEDHVYQGAEGEEAKMALREAWADFQLAKERATEPGWKVVYSDGREAWHPGERIGYSVDILEESLRWVPGDRGAGHFVRDGERRVIGSWSGTELDGQVVVIDKMRLRALAEKLHKPTEAILCSACGQAAVDLRYSPEGQPFCEGHLPRPQDAI